ncbi:MAG: DoxX family membrane protein [Tannerellaceae bacterium]|nr:DoxX family membrane protein [Tannerellaceae bacterium]
MRVIITIIRMAIGWHFLYEGLTKLFADNWSAESFLSNTFGFTSGFYHWLASSPVSMQLIDLLNIYGLIFIGLALFIGLCIRWASLGGIALLLLYYFAYPPFGISLLGMHDGSVFIVNKIFVEAVMLVFILFYKEKGYGIDGLIRLYKKLKEKKMFVRPTNQPVNNRREAIKNLVSIPVLGAIGGGAWWSSRIYETDASTGATIQVNRVELSRLKGELPKGKLGNLELSRLIMGGNLIGGWAHARDLLYAESLFKAYNTEKKIIETLMLCEQAGINCINIGYPTMSMMTKYRQLTGSSMKVIVQVGIDEKNEDIYDNVTQAIDNGMDIIQLQGNWGDWLVRDKKFDVIAGMMDRIKSQGYIAGLAAHTVDSLIACEEQGIIPDYYMKTMHHDNYWSAHPRENRQPFEVDGQRHRDHNMFHDNCFCLFPDRTAEFVNRAKVPVMGFKVLAAGAISPQDGFNWAFENGADFICVGMFDFQVVDDVNICIDTLQKLQNRKREWYA